MSNTKQKKNEQLGMNYSTASNRLVKDLLFNFIKETERDVCHICKQKLSREDFTIEHKKPWLDSENPVELFFDLSNIAFSHAACNYGAARKYISPCGTSAKYNNGCRCKECKEANATRKRDSYNSEYRKARYEKNEKHSNS